jgi:Beta-lactamase enzyme family
MGDVLGPERIGAGSAIRSRRRGRRRSTGIGLAGAAAAALCTVLATGPAASAGASTAVPATDRRVRSVAAGPTSALPASSDFVNRSRLVTATVSTSGSDPPGPVSAPAGPGHANTAVGLPTASTPDRVAPVHRSVSRQKPAPAFDAAAAWRTALAGRPGHAAVAMFDAHNGRTASVADPAVGAFETASSVKLSILAALLVRDGPAGLSGAELRTAATMISISDNDAASDLWSDVGGASAMDGFFARLGMTGTTAGTEGAWGLTHTTALDQLQLLKAVSYPNTTLSDAARHTVVALLDTVVPDQRWGIPDGVPAGAAAVAVKNGWLPRPGGWVVSSVGHVVGSGRDYVIAVMTDGEPSEAAGIGTIRDLSAIAWRAATTAP